MNEPVSDEVWMFRAILVSVWAVLGLVAVAELIGLSEYHLVRVAPVAAGVALPAGSLILALKWPTNRLCAVMSVLLLAAAVWSCAVGVTAPLHHMIACPPAPHIGPGPEETMTTCLKTPPLPPPNGVP